MAKVDYTPPVGAPPYTSYSQLTTYAQCGEKYRLTRIVGLTDGYAWWNFAGTAVHTATEWYDLGSTPGLTFDPEQAFNTALDDELEKAGYTRASADEDETIRASRGQTQEWWRREGPGMVAAWVKWREETGWRIWEGAQELGVEYKLDVQLDPDDPESRVLAYLDRIFVDGDGQLVIVDLKSGARRPDSSLQLGVYRAALLAQDGVHADLGGYWMARKSECEIVGLSDYDPGHVRRYVANLRRAIAADVFMPNRSSFCKSCGVAAHCWAVNPTLKATSGEQSTEGVN